MQESNSCFTSDLDVFLLPIMSLSASPESQVAQRHSAPTPHIRHVAPWRLGYKHVSSTNFSTFDFSFQDVEATAESGGRPVLTRLQSATQRGRHRGQGHLQRPVDRLHQSNHIVRLKAAQLLGGLADIAVVDVSQEAPITTRAHHCIIQSTVSGLLMRPTST